MKKLSHNNIFVRIFYFLVAVLPVAILFYFKTTFNWEFVLKSWATVLCVFWGLLLASVGLVNFLDWDVYSEGKCFTFKRLLTTRRACDERFVIRPIPVLSLFLYLYFIQFENGERFMFRHLPIRRYFFFGPISTTEKEIHDKFLNVK